MIVYNILFFKMRKRCCFCKRLITAKNMKRHEEKCIEHSLNSKELVKHEYLLAKVIRKTMRNEFRNNANLRWGYHRLKEDFAKQARNIKRLKKDKFFLLGKEFIKIDILDLEKKRFAFLNGYKGIKRSLSI